LALQADWVRAYNLLLAEHRQCPNASPAPDAAAILIPLFERYRATDAELESLRRCPAEEVDALLLVITVAAIRRDTLEEAKRVVKAKMERWGSASWAAEICAAIEALAAAPPAQTGGGA